MSDLWKKHPGVRSGERLTRGERAADTIRNGMGSWGFIFSALLFLAGWMIGNRGSGFDPYPFILLNLILSCLAAMQGAILLIATKRQDQISSELAIARLRDEHRGRSDRQSHSRSDRRDPRSGGHSHDMSADVDSVRHLYVHVPFCPTICDFCSFEVLERRSGMVAPYLDRVDGELAALADRGDVGVLRSVYLGGGTPSSLRSAEIAALVEAIRRRLGGWEEMTLEVHPSTASADRFEIWRSLGVTRFSIGAQSFDDDVLRWLTRPHDAVANHRAIEWALATGAAVSVDLMTAIPHQDVAADVASASASGVGHVSAYVVTIEEGTPFADARVETDELSELGAIRSAATGLEAAGFERYEVSNWSRSISERCHHNEAYWANSWWAAVGPGASAHLPPLESPRSVELADASSLHPDPRSRGAVAVRTRSGATTAWLSGESPTIEFRTAREAASESILTGLRRTSGVDLVEVAHRWGESIVDVGCTAVRGEVASGRLVVEGSRVSATVMGMEQLDAVTAALLAD